MAKASSKISPKIPEISKSAGEIFNVEQFKQGKPKTFGQLILGDNLQIGRALPKEYRGKIKLIYIDPPFDIGQDLVVELSPGARKQRMVAYSDRWQGQDYEKMMLPRLELAYELLSEEGSLYLHCDYRTTARLRVMLESIFGSENYINEIIWFYKTGGVPRNLGFSRKHDTIHFVVKNKAKALWNPQRERSYLSHHYGFSNIEIFEDEKGPYTLTAIRDVWDIPALRGNQPERVNYPTQKPEALLERIVLASSNPGDYVLDLFAGSGTSAVVAQKNERNWIAIDQQPLAIHTARKRLISIPDSELRIGAGSQITSAKAQVKITVERNNEITSLLIETLALEAGGEIDPKAVVDMWAIGEGRPEGFIACSHYLASEDHSKPLRCEYRSKAVLIDRLALYTERGERFEFELPKQSGSFELGSL